MIRIGSLLRSIILLMLTFIIWGNISYMRSPYGGVEGVEVNLFKVSCGGEIFKATTTTDIDGDYIFRNLSETMEYKVEPVEWDGHTFLPPYHYTYPWEE